jgi:type IV pilus assembly protein PilQ
MISNVPTKLINLCSLLLLATVLFGGANSVHASSAMVTVTSVDISTGSVVLNTDSKLVVFKSYTLGAPSRLVIDVENALPEFSDRRFTINDGFKDLRIGLYADKTRFVFDALNNVLPDARVEHVDGKLIIAWGVQDKVVTAPVVPGTPNAIEQIDFDASNGQSVFTVSLSSQADLILPTVDGDVIRFGVRDTVIPRSLRRVVDASVFPSAVLQITPYSTIVAGGRCVMFAARMKGPVDYTVNLVGSSLVFTTVDGPFAEVAAEKVSSVVIPVGGTQTTQTMANVDSVDQVIDSLNSSSLADEVEIAVSYGAPVKVYTGEPVTLEFDDADIRTVMTLVAEVSEQNIILSDDVQGNLTLRLHDVPWDQALDLILEIKELGTIEQGNVVRVLPLKQIEAMETARLQAKQTIKRFEETQTQIFEVNYKDVDTIADVIEDMLSDQGEVSAIDGSKKLMVTDIPSKLVEIGDLLILLDEPVKQVLIEARIVEMRTTEGIDIGVNWGIGYTNDVATSDINRSLDITGTNLVTGEDTTDNYSLTRVDGVQTTTTSTDDGAGNTTNNVDTSLIGIGTNTINDLAFGLGGAFALPSTLGTSGLGGLINFGRVGLDSTTLSLKLSALESSGNVKVVSSPRILTLDGESARIEQGTQIPYQSVSDQGTVTEFKNATLSLEVTPEVNPDDTVILEIIASNSTIGSTVSTGAGSAPAIDTKEAETKLLLKDGETTVIGGIFIENTLNSNTGTPFLKDIPYLGKLFESNSASSDRSELLIFITPHIVVQ